MEAAMKMDKNFVQMAAPLLHEFGFGSIKELVQDQISIMLLSKIDHYESECKFFERKFGKDYSELLTICEQTDVEDFDMEDSLNDWRYAIEAVELYRTKLKTIQNA